MNQPNDVANIGTIPAHYWPIKFQQQRSLNSLNISKQHSPHVRRLHAHNFRSKTRSLLNWLVSDFDSSTCQPRLSTAQNDFSKFRPGWWQFCWMIGVKFNSIHSILVRFLHITQFTVCAAKNLTVFVADSPPAAAGLGSPGDSRSHSGHVGNTRRRRLITCCRLWPSARRFWLGLHLGLHSPQKQSQFYKLCNKTITKLLYHRLPTFLRQRTPIFRNIQIHISR